MIIQPNIQKKSKTYEDVFSQDIGCLRKATDVYEKILEIRKDLEEDNGTPAAAPAGPLHLLLTAPAAKLWCFHLTTYGNKLTN